MSHHYLIYKILGKNASVDTLPRNPPQTVSLSALSTEFVMQ